MFMLCLMGGGGMAMLPPMPMLALGLTLGWGLAGLRAMAAQEVGLGAEELTEGMLLAAMLLMPPVPPSGEPTVLVAATMSEPSLSPAIPGSMLPRPGSLLSCESLPKPACPSAIARPKELGA